MSAADELPSIEPKDFWSALGSRATGAAAVTARGADGPAKPFSQLSVQQLRTSSRALHDGQ